MTTDQQEPVTEHAAEGPVLRRSRDHRVFFGVCGGLARYLGVDPVLVRIAFVLLAIFGGSGLLLYLIALIAIPAQAPGETVPAGTASAASGPAVVIGAVLIAAGSLMLAGRVIPAFGDLMAPLVLVAVGVLVILAGRR